MTMFDLFSFFKPAKSPNSTATTEERAAGEAASQRSTNKDGGTVKVLKKGPAMRVIFFYPGEEGTYIDNADVTLYENGVIHIKSNQEETTTHLQNCEILWRFETEADDRTSKVRLLKPKGAQREDDKNAPGPDRSPEV
jgi:hypothetical protein